VPLCENFFCFGVHIVLSLIALGRVGNAHLLFIR